MSTRTRQPLGRGTMTSGADVSADSGKGVVPSGGNLILSSTRTPDAAALLSSGSAASGDEVGAHIGGVDHCEAGAAITELQPITTAADGQWVPATTAGDSILGVARSAATAAADEFEALLFGYKIGTVGMDLSALGIQSTAVALTAAAWTAAPVKIYTGSGAPVSHDIPSALTTSGRLFVVIDGGGGAGADTITLTTEGAETINGAATATITSNYGVIMLISDGTNWYAF